MLLTLKIIGGFLLLLIVAGIVRTWQVNHGRQQELFTSGTVPSPLPDGLYHGSVSGYSVSWQGKKFHAADSTGLNVFNDGERYPFTTSVGKGLTDTDKDVMKIEYDIPGNPFWLRLILDEIVQTAPGHYLGKVHVRIIPGLPFTLGYFELAQ